MSAATALVLLVSADGSMRRAAMQLAQEVRSLIAFSAAGVGGSFADRPLATTLAECIDQASADCVRAAAAASAWPLRAPPLLERTSFEDLAMRAGHGEGVRYASAVAELASWVGVLCPTAAAFARAYASKRVIALAPALSQGNSDPPAQLLVTFRALAALASALPPPSGPHSATSSGSLGGPLAVLGQQSSSSVQSHGSLASQPSQLPSPTEAASADARGRELARALCAALVAPNAPNVALAAAAALGVAHAEALCATVDELGALADECASERPRHKGRKLVYAAYPARPYTPTLIQQFKPLATHGGLFVRSHSTDAS